MAPQQIHFAETIRAMKLAMKRRADDSDSDHSIHAATNRGNKLQRGAQYVRSGRLDTTGGTQSYRKKINHAGYTRHIISKNPPVVDADGDILSPTELSREASPVLVEDNAFDDVQLDVLLRPLTAAAELPTRPTYKAAFTSPALTQMVDQVAEMARKERATLWKAKRLLQRFRGDAEWMPCEVFETEHDEMLLSLGGLNAEGSEGVGMPRSVLDSVGESAPLDLKSIEDGNSLQIPDETKVEAMEGIQAADMAILSSETNEHVDEAEATTKAEAPEQTEPYGDDATKTAEDPISTIQDAAVTSIEQPPEVDAVSEGHTSNSDRNTTQHAMTTRARARSPIASPSPSPTPSDSASIPPINPWFMIPPSALPDRDLGLPAAEAEESRRGLLLYVQKQEQIVRSLDTLYNGLQRSDRMRNELFAACKAEGHMRVDGRGNMVTDMSDGEDWYDPFDWGLEARDLKFGKDGMLGLEKGKDEIDEMIDEGEGRRGVRRRRVTRM